MMALMCDEQDGPSQELLAGGGHGGVDETLDTFAVKGCAAGPFHQGTRLVQASEQVLDRRVVSGRCDAAPPRDEPELRNHSLKVLTRGSLGMQVREEQQQRLISRVDTV